MSTENVYKNNFKVTNTGSLDSLIKVSIAINKNEFSNKNELSNYYKFDEDSPLKASNPYSASKAAADLLVLSYFKMYNFRAFCPRFDSLYHMHA